LLEIHARLDIISRGVFAAAVDCRSRFGKEEGEKR